MVYIGPKELEEIQRERDEKLKERYPNYPWDYIQELKRFEEESKKVDIRITSQYPCFNIRT
jgi:hypothetical protein